ncbi:hypothetical protein PROFUN_08589 [Planoprotostelium fungivorum]|uniref:Uncharacterized protein n=1 Tax=Planoprotostelium fungivorum TaxID=1890364 RepID=A0A2P6NJ78_9EUKA|nr:hypothetical protein PROFUN_08589 [Planoprotostelium fungivorum]
MAEEEADVQIPIDSKPLSGGVFMCSSILKLMEVSIGAGMSWAEFQKQMEEEDAKNGIVNPPPTKTVVKKKVPAKKAAAATSKPVDPEEAEKKRLRDEAALKRREEMKQQMASARQTVKQDEPQPEKTEEAPAPIEESTSVAVEPIVYETPSAYTAAEDLPIQKKSDGPSWADFMAQVEAEEATKGNASTETAPPPKKAAVKKAVAAKPIDPEEAEKKRLRDEAALKRREEMKQQMAAARQATKQEEPASEPQSQIEQAVVPTATSPVVDEPPITAAAASTTSTDDGIPLNKKSDGPSWADFMAQVEAEEGNKTSEPTETAPPPKKAPVKKAVAAKPVDPEEAEKKRLRDEAAVKRREEMKQQMAAARQATKKEDPAPETPLEVAAPTKTDSTVIEEKQQTPVVQPKQTIAEPPNTPSEKVKTEESEKKSTQSNTEKRLQEMREVLDRTRNAQKPVTSPTSMQNARVLQLAVNTSLPPSPSLNLERETKKSGGNFTPAPAPAPLPTSEPRKPIKTMEQVRSQLHCFREEEPGAFLKDVKISTNSSVDPTSRAKFSRTEMISTRRMVNEQAREEAEQLLEKLAALQEKCREEEAHRERMGQIASNFDHALNALPQVLEEMTKTKVYYQEKERAFLQAKALYENAKREQETLLSNDVELRRREISARDANALLRSQYDKYTAEAQHTLSVAETRLQHMNQQHELLSYVLQSKIARTTTRGESMKGRVQILEKENVQLLKLAEDLMQKMDGLP